MAPEDLLVQMKVAVFHPGTQHSWQTSLALQDLDRLAWYATSIFYQPGKFPYSLEQMVPKAVAVRLHARFKRFSHPRLDPALVRTSGLTEWFERIAARAGWRKAAHWLDVMGNHSFTRALAADIRSNQPFALWGYNGSSLGSFVMAQDMGRRCILDRTIGDFRYYNARMAELHEEFGEWFLPTERAIGSEQIERDQREFELSDVILLGSEFAANTIRLHAGDAVAAKVRVLNYCYDEALFANQPAPRPVPKDGPVKFLFIGQINPRKGIHHLLKAMARVPKERASLTIVGDLRIPQAVFSRYADRVTYVPTVARSDIPAIMADHHCLIFPSYFEGSALSLLEGLASGLAIIQTPMSGMGVTPRTGIMLEKPDTAALHHAIERVTEQREQLDSWRAAAQAEAAAYSFSNYRARIASLLDDLAI